MKKILYSAAALALAFFAASCQQENLEPVMSGNTVTYTVQVADAVATRALGDDITAVNELVYEVYRTKEEGVVDFSDEDNLLYHKTAEVKNGVATIEIEFVNDQNFTVLFWAHVQGNDVYDVDDLTAVTITSPDVANNVNAQAFVGRDFVRDCVSDNNGKVTLVRPVSQLNIATTPESLVFEAEDGERGSSIRLDGSSVKVTGLATSYNIATLSAFGEPATEYEYTETAVPGDVLTVNGKNYTYVAMNYVGFAPEMGTSDVTVSYVINTSEGYIDNEILNVPVKPNYRTNIIGNLITSKTDYTIELDKTWGELPPVEVVTNAKGLQKAINEIPAGGEGEIVLDGDINLSELFAELTKSATQDITYLTVPAGKEVVLNLNGYSLTGVDQTQKNFGLIQNNGKLTVKNTAAKASKMSLVAEHNDGWNRYSAVISNNPGAELTVEGNIVIEHLGGTDMSYGIDALTNGTIGAVKTTIDGATVTSTYRAIRQFLNSASTDNELLIKAGSTIRGAENNKAVFFHDPSEKANKGKITIEERASVSGVYLYVTPGSTEWPVEVSIAASSIAEGYEVVPANVPKGYSVEEVDGIWTVEFHPVAKIGEKGYATLIDAVAAVKDGETITLVADEVFTETNRSNNSGYWDGLAYSGDKSFTIDLGGHTIKQDGSLNDYLMWIKNDGAKANTITLKNGTMDAGTTAYSAFATASSNKQTITVNLEDINLINNISNGAVVKARGGSVLNVKAGTVITGKNSYTGIEAVGNTTIVNIYEGAKIYQNGTSSSWGWLVGASYNATVNVYGGEGKSARGAFGAMTSGGTINISGGEWIANNDGPVANDNRGVLIAQSDKQYNSGAGNAVVNVTGGTFKGGYNCYGNTVGDAQINIKGGNFNANPETYVVKGYEAKEENGIYVVSKTPEATVNGTSYGTLAEAVAAAKAGETVTVIDDVTLSSELALPAGIIFNGNGKQINGSIYACAEGNLTFAGHTKVTSFSASYYNRTITIGEGACLEVTGGGRVSLAYGNTFNITGSIKNAKTADKANVQPSLIIPGGISITGGNDAAMNVTNAYVKIGGTTSKPGVANGKFALNFNNSIAEFTNEFGFYEPTGGKNPTFEMSITNSVFTTGAKLCVAAANSTITVNNSNVLLGTYLRNSGELNITNGSVLTGKTIQFGENGGNNGTIKVDASTLQIVAGSSGNAFDGKGIGSISATNGATVNVDYYKAMDISTDATSTFTGTEVK